MCELDGKNLTYYIKAHHYESQIDRAFISMPSWMIRQMDMRSYVKMRPFSMSKHGLSDHAAIIW
eukprot:3139488-Karenia_brevis.AAC.1